MKIKVIYTTITIMIYLSIHKLIYTIVPLLSNKLDNHQLDHSNESILLSNGGSSLLYLIPFIFNVIFIYILIYIWWKLKVKN